MEALLGHSVLNCKAELSLDCEKAKGQNVLMPRDPVNAYLLDFGSRLREARGQRTTTSVAKMLGIDQSGYSKFENGKREMPLHLIPVFCDACNVDPEWLVMGPRRKRAAG